MTAAERQTAFEFPHLSQSEGGEPAKQRPRLALLFDNRGWLSLLAEEWWTSTDRAAIRLGVDAAIRILPLDDRIPVIAWFDPWRLPDRRVLARRAGDWQEIAVKDVTATDEEVIWEGPIPLFAVSAFSVASESDKIRLGAMYKGFSNLSELDTPIIVEAVKAGDPAPQPSSPLAPAAPPRDWNALRGAAAMAVWAVPAIPPWLDVLCDSLIADSRGTSAKRLRVPWWYEPPWRSAREACDDWQVVLWRAAIEVLRKVRIREEWRPGAVIEGICDAAMQLGGKDSDAARLVAETRSLLEDKSVVTLDGNHASPVSMALQLVLLRPSPERFVAWKDELRSMQPAVWWTGATLAGLICGYRDLDNRFRGLPEGRKFLALRTWCLDRSTNEMPPEGEDQRPEWVIKDGKVSLQLHSKIWATRTESSRGKWFRANFENDKVRHAAISISERSSPQSLSSCLTLKDEEVPIRGKGSIVVEGDHVRITGEVSIVLQSTSKVSVDLDVEAFREWMLTGSIGERLPEPPRIVQGIEELDVQVDPKIPGLRIVPNFISVDEETDLIAAIDKEPWMHDLSRRVQHYGWRYDYKAKRIDNKARLGELPTWATTFAQRLFAKGIVNEIPDQVIVNEYVLNQGIAKHIDCLPCFRGPIVTISLCESWGMIFRSPRGEKLERTLERCSVAILDGEVRSKWTHEIPKRLREHWGNRKRRLSLTFRKVDHLSTETSGHPDIQPKRVRQGRKPRA